MRYRTGIGEVLDRICFDHYGRSSAVVDVLKANPGLTDHPAVLPEGVIVTLPDLPPEEATDEQMILWT